MKHSLRKGNTGVHVTYRNGGYSNNLIASDFTLEADEKRVFLSMDFSASEATRNKSSNTYNDVQELIDQAPKVEFFQIANEKWIAPLISALNTYPDASRELAIRFKSSAGHTYRYALRVDSSNLEFAVRDNGD